MRFDTKIAVILRDDLPTWQKLNMTAFLTSGIAAKTEGVIGEAYEDGSGVAYLPMFVQPVLVFQATSEQLRAAYEQARSRDIQMAIFTDQLFATGHDQANRAAVRSYTSELLELAGIALRAERKAVDAVVKGLTLYP